MSVILSFGVLHSAPGHRSSLRRDHDDFGALLHEARIDQSRRDAERANGANVNRFDLIREIKRFQSFLFRPKVSSIVDELNTRNHVGNMALAGEPHMCNEDDQGLLWMSPHPAVGSVTYDIDRSSFDLVA